MATIKSYTDLEQSKKLAEFLPHESADMYYPNRIDIKYKGALPIEFKHGNPLLSQEIAAWSLTALLGVLTENKICHYEDRYYCQHISEGGEFPYYSTAEYYNPVDACVAMIEHLHEFKML